MNGDTVAVLDLRLPLNKRKKIVECVNGDVIALGVYPLTGKFLFAVGYLGNVRSNYFYAIGIVADAPECHHHAAFLLGKRGGDGGSADALRLLYVGKGGYVRAAPLHNIKLYRAYLAAEVFRGVFFKIFSYTRKVFVSEGIGKLRGEVTKWMSKALTQNMS